MKEYVLKPCPTPERMTITRNIGTIILRAFRMAFAGFVTVGTNVLCSVFFSGLSENDNRAGIKNITDTKLATMPFAKAKPISTPMGSDISASDSSPAIVVREEESISTMPLESATESACFTSQYFWRSSINLCSKIME